MQILGSSASSSLKYLKNTIWMISSISSSYFLNNFWSCYFLKCLLHGFSYYLYAPPKYHAEYFRLITQYGKELWLNKFCLWQMAPEHLLWLSYCHLGWSYKICGWNCHFTFWKQQLLSCALGKPGLPTWQFAPYLSLRSDAYLVSGTLYYLKPLAL